MIDGALDDDPKIYYTQWMRIKLGRQWVFPALSPASDATQQSAEVLEDHDDRRVGARQEVHDERRAGVVRHLLGVLEKAAGQPLQRL